MLTSWTASAAPLVATANSQSTYYLYGLEAVAERASSWSYYLRDGLGSLRRVADSSADILYERSYTPWGDVLSQSGALNPSLGYLGGWVDAATGLIYVGNGQYYDPATGRFLTRGAQEGQLNPYTPGRGDPTSLLIGPLALLVLVQGRKKGRKGRKAALFLVVLLVLLVGGMSLTACHELPPKPTDGKTPIGEPTKPGNETLTPTGTQGNTPTATQSPSETPFPPAPACPTPEVKPSISLDDIFQITKEEIEQAGGLMNILEQEDETVLMARVAMGEAQDREDERSRIMWLVQVRKELGYTNSIRGSETSFLDRFGAKSTVRQEILSPGEFAVIDLIRQGSISDPEQLDDGSNLKAMLYPTGTKLDAIQKAHADAQTIHSTHDNNLRDSNNVRNSVMTAR